MKLGNTDSVISKALGFLCCPADHTVGTVASLFLPFSPVPQGLRDVLWGGQKSPPALIVQHVGSTQEHFASGLYPLK